MRNALVVLLAATAALAFAVAPARADAIDGNWCFADGRHFSIRGPAFVASWGERTQGQYDRHGFTYLPAAGGAAIVMTLVNEETVHLRRSAETGAPAEVWKRCVPVS
ncbi:MAG: hypothetical protein JNK11_21315 [Alphaproteobacteria bacterium]|nr:hypothetical protein [Alphaproteobacteria bacterium]